ncbi:MAG: hypothetical protein A2026_18470 [Deltaproteobacteria bacterium RBG_19FT_COMBO_46_12]|jgi:hypothetical protein|nr:MAG: hypothetical protein A2026_18470 [Deltaproteobacteria bacterium RBG_19FT_COMBO_46_12]
MKIECFFSEGCGSKEQLMHNIEQVLRKEGIEAQVSSREISEEEANRLGIGGSPTIWVDGNDIEPGAPPGGIS